MIDILEDSNMNQVYFLSAFANEVAIENIDRSIKGFDGELTFIIGIRNTVTTYQALKRLMSYSINLYTVDTAARDGIFHVKTVLAKGTDKARFICGSPNLTTGGIANNIEGGVIAEFDLHDEQDKVFINEVDKYISLLLGEHSNNVKKISSVHDIEELYNKGLLVNENRAVYREVARNETGRGKETVITRFPFERKQLIFPPRKRKQHEAILRELNEVNIVLTCSEVWRSKKLKKTHLGISDSLRTHPKGEMSLGKGQYQDIDQYVYFRENVFNKLDWRNDTKGDQVAKASFTLIICGINYGKYLLEVLHKRPGMVAYKQKNYVTSIRWGECAGIIRKKELIGKEMRLMKIEDDHFAIIIE